MDGLNTTLSVLAVIVSVLIIGYLVFVRRKVGELQYRWETGRWPRSESEAIDSLNRWEDEQDVADLDAEITRTKMEIARVSDKYQQQRAELGALFVIREVIGQLEKRQKALLDKRKHKARLASIAGSRVTATSTGPPTLTDDSQPVNGKVSEPGRLVAASKS